MATPGTTAFDSSSTCPVRSAVGRAGLGAGSGRDGVQRRQNARDRADGGTPALRAESADRGARPRVWKIGMMFNHTADLYLFLSRRSHLAGSEAPPRTAENRAAASLRFAAMPFSGPAPRGSHPQDRSQSLLHSSRSRP